MSRISAGKAAMPIFSPAKPFSQRVNWVWREGLAGHTIV